MFFYYGLLITGLLAVTAAQEASHDVAAPNLKAVEQNLQQQILQLEIAHAEARRGWALQKKQFEKNIRELEILIERQSESLIGDLREYELLGRLDSGRGRHRRGRGNRGRNDKSSSDECHHSSSGDEDPATPVPTNAPTAMPTNTPMPTDTPTPIPTSAPVPIATFLDQCDMSPGVGCIRETFPDPLGGFYNRWWGQNTNMASYYLSDGNCDVDARGNAPTWLWIADEPVCGNGIGDTLFTRIEFDPPLSGTATCFALNMFTCVSGMTITVYSVDNSPDGTQAVSSTCWNFDVVSFALNNSISAIEFTAAGQVEGNTGVDYIEICGPGLAA